MLRLLVCGDRNWTDGDFIYDMMVDFSQEVTIIEGGARGADTLARRAAEYIGLAVIEFPADWNHNGVAAGPIRNRQMLTDGKPDVVWAFHDNIEDSKGTIDMLLLAKHAKVEYHPVHAQRRRK